MESFKTSPHFNRLHAELYVTTEGSERGKYKFKVQSQSTGDYVEILERKLSQGLSNKPQQRPVEEPAVGSGQTKIRPAYRAKGFQASPIGIQESFQTSSLLLEPFLTKVVLH